MSKLLTNTFGFNVSPSPIATVGNGANGRGVVGVCYYVTSVTLVGHIVIEVKLVVSCIIVILSV